MSFDEHPDKKPECCACGATDYEGELIACPYCDDTKCEKCDMGDDAACINCEEFDSEL